VIYDEGSRPPKKSSGPGHRSDFSLKSGRGLFLLGTFLEILERGRGGCPLCTLVLQSLEKPTEFANTTALSTSEVIASLKERESICFVNWEIDGRDNDPFSGRKARTRRLHLHWNNKQVQHSYLVFVAPKRLFEINSDSRGSWEREAFFLGRKLEFAGNNQVLMKSWLDQCSEQHSSSCSGDHDDEFLDMVQQSYFGVIDCLDMCLKSLPLRPSIKVTKVADHKSSSSEESSSPDKSGRSHPVTIIQLLNDGRSP
jgi:hypothetical protein